MMWSVLLLFRTWTMKWKIKSNLHTAPLMLLPSAQVVTRSVFTSEFDHVTLVPTRLGANYLFGLVHPCNTSRESDGGRKWSRLHYYSARKKLERAELFWPVGLDSASISCQITAAAAPVMASSPSLFSMFAWKNSPQRVIIKGRAMEISGLFCLCFSLCFGRQLCWNIDCNWFSTDFRL